MSPHIKAGPRRKIRRAPLPTIIGSFDATSTGHRPPATGHRITVHVNGTRIVLRTGPARIPLSRQEAHELIHLLHRAQHAARPDAD